MSSAAVVSWNDGMMVLCLTYSGRGLSHIQKLFTSQAWLAIVFQESYTAQEKTGYDGFDCLIWSLL